MRVHVFASNVICDMCWTLARPANGHIMLLQVCCGPAIGLCTSRKKPEDTTRTSVTAGTRGMGGQQAFEPWGNIKHRGMQTYRKW